MTFRRLAAALGLAAATAMPAWAQPGAGPNRFTTQPPAARQATTPNGRPINERHERVKTEAQAAYQKGDYQHTLTLMEGVLKEAPRDDVALYLRGSARVDIGRRDGNAKLVRDGVADARQAITIKPQDNAIYYLPYLYGMASLAQLEQRPEHAEVAIKVGESIVTHPSVKAEDKANIHYQMGVAHMIMKDPTASAKDYEQALRMSPNHLGALMALADAYTKAGDAAKAENAYDRATTALPKNALVFNNRGSFRQSKGDVNGAVDDFTKAIELDPTFGVAFTNRGFALMTAGNLNAAENDFTASLNTNPNQDSVYSFRGASRLGQGKVDSAIADFTQLIERSPKNSVAWSDLGFARFFAKDYKGASQAFDQAVGLNQNMKYLNPWRYWSMTLGGAPEDKVKEFGAEVGSRPKDHDWVDGLAAYATGNLSHDDLVSWADEKNPKLKQEQLCEAYYFQGLKLAQEGKQKESEEAFEKAIATNARHLSSYRGSQFSLSKFSDSGKLRK